MKPDPKLVDAANPSVDLDRVDAYDFSLPERLIAAHPTQGRGGSRLLVADRRARSVRHDGFARIGSFLRAGDLLVFNDTRVIPARLRARKQTGGAVELLAIDVLRPTGAQRWQVPADGSLQVWCMTRASRPIRAGMDLSLEGGADAPAGKVLRAEPGRALVEFIWGGSAAELFERAGEMPLPPYILKRREALGEQPGAQAEDLERYQTVYASRPGAVAAPTAGLHFSPELMAELKQQGVEVAFVTLRVGPGTFKPVTAERLSAHDMHAEEYEISAQAGEAVRRAKAEGRRVVAVGTTTTRALEAEARRATPFEPGMRQTSLFLTPGETFEVVDGLITNFHLPRSTLLALVAGFAGYDFMREIYRAAIEREYRFYSYGDAMLIV